jgi:hypothetical protein
MERTLNEKYLNDTGRLMMKKSNRQLYYFLLEEIYEYKKEDFPGYISKLYDIVLDRSWW